jgi:hypothetical protein
MQHIQNLLLNLEFAKVKLNQFHIKIKVHTFNYYNNLELLVKPYEK